MAFRTNKVPAIEERTVSGSSVSFNSAFALPLKACKVSFSATQAGSGDPSPSNPRAISGVSAIGLTANSTPVSISLGDTRYGGELDVVNKKLFITHFKIKVSDYDWSYNAVGAVFVSGNIEGMKQYPSSGLLPSYMCDSYSVTQTKLMSTWDNAAYNNCISARATTLNNIIIKDTRYTTPDDFIQNMGNCEIVLDYATPIEIDLSSIPDLSSIIGNNTFSTDTGTLEITFSDLQTKSASGSVATFNTALAMPLSSCNIAVNAWQEGSGDPSPSNVRTIHGFSEVNATRAGKNLFNYESVTWENGYLDDNQEYHDSTVTHYSSPFPITPNTIITASGFSAAYTSNIYMLDRNKNWLGRLTARYTTKHHFTTPQNCYYLQIQCQQQENGSNLQFEVGSEATAYEPYVTPTIYTIQLGEEVYGAEVDIVNGKFNLTWYGKKLSDLSWTRITSGVEFPYFRADFSDYKYVANNSNIMCEVYKFNGAIGATGSTEGLNATSDGRLRIRDNSYSDKDTWLADVGNYIIAYELSTPFDIQLTPTQIETLIGNNTIFADTGDVDLTYKDLDIAKRGNFREVFKLPS